MRLWHYTSVPVFLRWLSTICSFRCHAEKCLMVDPSSIVLVWFVNSSREVWWSKTERIQWRRLIHTSVWGLGLNWEGWWRTHFPGSIVLQPWKNRLEWGDKECFEKRALLLWVAACIEERTVLEFMKRAYGFFRSEPTAISLWDVMCFWAGGMCEVWWGVERDEKSWVFSILCEASVWVLLGELLWSSGIAAMMNVQGIRNKVVFLLGMQITWAVAYIQT